MGRQAGRSGYEIRKPKLLVLLGAGSSASVGLPLVSQLNGLMLEWSRELGVIDGQRCEPNAFEAAWNAVEEHLTPWPAHREMTPNFELALASMAALANWVRPRPHGRPLRELINAHEQLPTLFQEYHLGELTTGDFGASTCLTTQYAQLVMRLAAHMRDLSDQAPRTHPDAFALYRDLMRELRERFSLGVYTLNYDNLAISALPDAFTGFGEECDRHGGRDFDPAAVHSRSDWDFVYHLHGSVHYSLPVREARRGVFQDKIQWRDDLRGEFVDGEAHGSDILDNRSDGTEIPRTTLVAGGLKLDQLLGDPFQTMYAALCRHAHEADAFLFAGYGFGDMHVNRAILSRMTRGDAPPPVLIVERTPDERPTMTSRVDGWPHRLLWALATGGAGFDMVPGTVRNLKRERRFETARDHIAVWHNGFLEALEELEALTSWLRPAR